ncbi:MULTISPECIES: fimbrial protein [Providencia]|uniref:fimbrial protein n=1 Tax=Providencia TaxID=586 RepID=UPI0032DAF9B8
MKVYHLFIIGFLSSISAYTNAACYQNPNFNNLQRTLQNQTITLQYDDMRTNVVLATINTSMFSGWRSSHSGTNSDCGAWQVGRFLNGWSSTNNIAPTNIPGIGVRVGINSSNIWFPFRIAYTDQSWGFENLGWKTEIVKTGRVTTSNYIRGGQLAQFSQENTKTNSTFILSTLYMPTNGIRINVVKCTATSANYSVQLGDWFDTQFKNIGDTSEMVNIPVILTCDKGTNIKATVTSSAGYVDETTGKIKLTGANSATGIAIQLLDKNNIPIKLKVKTSLQNNIQTNEYLFNWKARYVKTANNITAGAANSTVIINISYE